MSMRRREFLKMAGAGLSTGVAGFMVPRSALATPASNVAS